MTGITKDGCVLFLCSVIETSRNNRSKVNEKLNLSELMVRNEIGVFLTLLGEDILFTESMFVFSLRIAILEAMRLHDDLHDALNEFWSSLKEIFFSEELAARLWKTSIKKLREDLKQGKGIMPTQEEFEQHNARKQEIEKQCRQKRASDLFGGHMAKHSGTLTWKAKCPECGQEKRLDSKTKIEKRKCNNCGALLPCPFDRKID